jgi:hypothetical protein
MYLIDKKKLLKDFANAIATPVGLTDSQKWPVRAGTVIFPVRNHLVREFIAQIEVSGIIGHPEKWRKAFYGPTQLWRMSHHLISGLLDDNLDKNQIAEKILLLLEGIAALNNDHYFNNIGAHIIMDDSKITNVIKTPMLGMNSANKLLRLSGAFWSYSEANYFVAHELTCEYHGAYKLDDGKFVVIRDLMNLKPIELWPDRDFNGLPDNMRIVTIHDNTLDIGYDVYNNLFDNNGTMDVSLLDGYAIAENKILSINDVAGLISCVLKKIGIFTREVDSMAHNAIAHKYMEVFWYRKKSLADYMGIDWKPPIELYKVLDDGLLAGPKKAVQKKGDTGKTLVEQLAEDYDFSDYIITGA